MLFHFTVGSQWFSFNIDALPCVSRYVALSHGERVKSNTVKFSFSLNRLIKDSSILNFELFFFLGNVWFFLFDMRAIIYEKRRRISDGS